MRHVLIADVLFDEEHELWHIHLLAIKHNPSASFLSNILGDVEDYLFSLA